MNQTIYFRKDVWKRFKDEEDKSKLVNKLLENHYGDTSEGVGRLQDEIVKREAAVEKFCKHDCPARLCKYNECRRKA